jgi:crotonobetainyl-CoA:carnitine CoA-transferase CaiB-like acyl-CoA transferase
VPLSPYRVIDLTDQRGHMAGYLLAALGADVIAVDPPNGSLARTQAPLATDPDVPPHARSLTHAAYGRGRRSVTADLATRGGRDVLDRLLAGADVLVESADPAERERTGLQLEEVARAHPHLVHVSITPFGIDGPKANWAATDLTVSAASGGLLPTGDADRPPVRLAVPQGFLFGGAAAAGAAILALYERGRSGQGQHVDVSATRAAALSTQGALLSAGVGTPFPRRSAGGMATGRVAIRFLYPAADGFVSITHAFGPNMGRGTARLMKWLLDEGFCDEAMAGKDWIDYGMALGRRDESIEDWERAKAAVEAFTSSKSRHELLQGAIARRLFMAPVLRAADLENNAQLAARDFWDHLPLFEDSNRMVAVPGPFAKLSATPLTRLGRAPAPGEHTAEVLAEAPRGSGLAEPVRRPPLAESSRRPAVEESGPAMPLPADGHPEDALPLAGVKVLDFTWAIAGPSFTRVLADFGATVVKVESTRRPDGARALMPQWKAGKGLDASATFDDMNAGKLSIALDMSKPSSVEVAKDLVRWADVVVESYSPRAMRKWGMSWPQLREINSNLIMFSTCLMGQTGPLADFAGYGNLAGAITGFYDLAGWPDRPPAGPYGAYTDYISSHVMVATLLAALDHRRRTGEGQHVDVAQAEAAIQFLAPAVLDWTVNGRIWSRDGNRDLDMAPHGVYPAAGDERWVAVACADDDQWLALCRLLERPDLAADPELSTAPGRVARSDELDAVVAEWTAQRSTADIEEQLQAAGVAAHVVAGSADLLADPQLAHQRHILALEHPDRGCLLENARFTLSRTPARVDRRAPLLGEHTWEVLTEMLGYDPDRVADLAAQEIFE